MITEGLHLAPREANNLEYIKLFRSYEILKTDFEILAAKQEVLSEHNRRTSSAKTSTTAKNLKEQV